MRRCTGSSGRMTASSTECCQMNIFYSPISIVERDSDPAKMTGQQPTVDPCLLGETTPSTRNVDHPV